MIISSIKKRIVLVSLALLRILIGWHFLYEGLIKILYPEWSAKQFLTGSTWILGDLFRWMASNETGIGIVNAANEYSLALIGLALILGRFTRLSSWGGVGLLLVYYLAYPPLGGYNFGSVAEGSNLIVNKNLIELFALIVIALTNSGQYFGLDRLIQLKKTKVPLSGQIVEEEPYPAVINCRMELIKGLTGIPILATFSGAF
jgi:thiosulfate dehydrogenase (quinone) large subunit